MGDGEVGMRREEAFDEVCRGRGVRRAARSGRAWRGESE